MFEMKNTNNFCVRMADAKYLTVGQKITFKVGGEECGFCVVTHLQDDFVHLWLDDEAKGNYNKWSHKFLMSMVIEGLE